MFISDNHHSIALSVTLYDNSIKGQRPDFAASFGRIIAKPDQDEDCICVLRSYATISRASQARLIIAMGRASCNFYANVVEIDAGQFTVADYYYHTGHDL